MGFLAAVIGDNISYFIGRAGGRRLILRYGAYVRLTGPLPRRAAGVGKRAVGSAG
jgi:membrane protein DedA with SNARE-associated domain